MKAHSMQVNLWGLCRRSRAANATVTLVEIRTHPRYYACSHCMPRLNKKNYNMIHHIIIGGFIDVYIVVRFVWF